MLAGGGRCGGVVLAQGPGRAAKTPRRLAPGRRWQAGATARRARLWTRGECVLRGLRGACVGGYEKAAKSSTEGSLPACEGGRQGRRGAGSLDTLPPWLEEGPQTDPTELSPTHLEDLPIRAMAQASKPIETLLEEGLRSAWVISGALQGLRGLVLERHPPGVGLMPAWGPRREEAADGDAALGRGPGWEAPAEPPGPLEGEARFCMAEVGWDWNRGATQGWRGALGGHEHVQHRCPGRQSMVCHSNGACSCGPKEKTATSTPHTRSALSTEAAAPRTPAGKGIQMRVEKQN